VLFTTADDVHDSLGRLMQELATDPEVGLRLSRLDTVVQLRYRNPDTAVTLVAREGDAPAVHLGTVPDGTPNPELVLTLDADVGHELWLGRHNVAVGIARGAIQAKGDTRRVVDLLSLTGDIAPHYEQLLRATGREALLEEPAAEEPAAEDAAAEGGADASAADGATGAGEDAQADAAEPTADAAGAADASPAEGDAPAEPQA
jgi:hypothetical protein